MPMLMLSSLDSMPSQEAVLLPVLHLFLVLLPQLHLLLLLLANLHLLLLLLLALKLFPNASKRLTDNADRSLSKLFVGLQSQDVSLFLSASLFPNALLCPSVLLFHSVLLCQGKCVSPPPGMFLLLSATPSQ